MRLVDDIPTKLLDCAEAQNVIWPAAFVRLGQAIRIDYTTTIHADNTLEAYKHGFSTGVQVYTPAGEEAYNTVVLEEAFSPIVMGVVDRLFVAFDNERTVLFSRPELIDSDSVEVDETCEMEVSFLAWDPENKQLVLLGIDGLILGVLAGGFLNLDAEGMIAG